MGKSNNVTANAAFLSQSKRETIAAGDAKAKPAPCEYTLSCISHCHLSIFLVHVFSNVTIFILNIT